MLSLYHEWFSDYIYITLLTPPGVIEINVKEPENAFIYKTYVASPEAS